MSNKHIINIDWFEALPQKIAPHNLIHPYELLYKKYSEASSVQPIHIRRKKYSDPSIPDNHFPCYIR
ncbi:MAG: hypothetical protein ACM3XP_07170 [Nitrososphaerales archaeon]